MHLGLALINASRRHRLAIALTSLALCLTFAASVRAEAEAEAPRLLGFGHPRIGLLYNVNEVGVNAFRNPSIGLEGRIGPVSLHVGGYPTIITKDAKGNNQNTWFLKAGATLFFLPHILYKREVNELYLQASYVRGFQNGFRHGFMADVGYRFMIYWGINVRIGAALLLTPDHKPRINPTPGIGWSYQW